MINKKGKTLVINIFKLKKVIFDKAEFFLNIK